MASRKNIGIIGIRGYKVVYSGYETFAVNLIEKSSLGDFYHIFSRSLYKNKSDKGKNFKEYLLSTIKNKYLETPFYALTATLKSMSLPIDVVLYLSVANTPFIWFQKLKNRRVVVNVDGLDWKRKRWSFLGKIYLMLCERICLLFADVLIADSKYVFDYYKKNYPKKNITHITYGANIKKRNSIEFLPKYKLNKYQYFLFVGRLTPENKVEDLLNAFFEIDTKYKCVIVGDSFFEDKYKNFLKNLAKKDHRIIFTGTLKGKAYEEILSNAFCYVETKSVGGVHPSLLEAMEIGNGIIARNSPEHVEALANTGMYFQDGNSVESLRCQMERVLKDKHLVYMFGKLSKKRVNKYF